MLEMKEDNLPHIKLHLEFSSIKQATEYIKSRGIYLMLLYPKLKRIWVIPNYQKGGYYRFE